MQQSNSFMQNVPTLNTRYFLKYDTIKKILKENCETLNPGTVINLFFDLRSCMPTVYETGGMTEITKSYKTMNDKFIYSRSIIALLNHWARFLRKEGFAFNLILFSESGDSSYHRRYLSSYKEKRKISKLKVHGHNQNLLDTSSSIIDYNIEVLDTVLNKMPDIYFINLKHLEADFIPHYIKNKYEMDNNDKNFNIIVSSDKDLLQSVNYNTIMVAKRSEYEVYNTTNIPEGLGSNKFKTFKLGKLKTPRMTALMLAIIGDSADDIPGIPGLGFKRTYDYLNNLIDTGVIQESSFNWTANELLKLIDDFKLTDTFSAKLKSHAKELKIYFKLTSFDELMAEMSLKKIIQITDVIERTNEYIIPDTITPLSIDTTLKQICIYQNNYSALLK